jgi:hypothetical protein
MSKNLNLHNMFRVISTLGVKDGKACAVGNQPGGNPHMLLKQVSRL